MPRRLQSIATRPGAVWSGRGREPLWIAGRDRTMFPIRAST
ncbi:H-NS family nucleoid-associated regulatory protein [Burkholderia ubonensis]